MTRLSPVVMSTMGTPSFTGPDSGEPLHDDRLTIVCTMAS